MIRSKVSLQNFKAKDKLQAKLCLLKLDACIRLLFCKYGHIVCTYFTPVYVRMYLESLEVINIYICTYVRKQNTINYQFLGIQQLRTYIHCANHIKENV